jgi:phosphohistidine phosphatase
MELYLLRHGIAEDGLPGTSDSVRKLTPEGREKTAAVLAAARRSGVSLTVILSSPYVRAVQTAQIAAKELHYEGDISLIDSLVPHGTPEGVWSDVRDYAQEPAILLAGHEPLMSALAAYLLNAPSLRIDMKKAALLRIDFDSVRAAPQGMLRWMLTPKLVTIQQ